MTVDPSGRDDDPQAVDGAAPRPGPAAGSGSSTGSGSSGPASGKSGIELAREALAQARADARKRGSVPGQGRRKGSGRPRPMREPGRGGDPKPFGAAIRELLASRGWEQRAAVGGVFGNWPRIVGPELARHTRPERFDDGELTVVADSNAWAQQVRLLSAQLVRRLNEELGHGTVRRVRVRGPEAGPRRTGGWRVR